MNFYNLQDFKCARCQHWFHPAHYQPYLLNCQHSVCSKCVQVNKNNRYVTCPYHKSQQILDNVKVNSHIQEALIRLIKNSGQNWQGNQTSDYSAKQKHLQSLIGQKQEDMKAFAKLLDTIYTNQINRIIQLKNRVRLEVVGHCQAFEEWKLLQQTCQNHSEISEQAKIVEQRIKEFNSLDLESMAEKVIQQPQIIFQRNFSIHDLIKIKQRTTLKSSVKPPHKASTSAFSAIPSRSQKQNYKYLNLINTVESPQPLSKNAISNILCKELSSFKLNQSQDHSIPEFTMKNSKLAEHLRLSSTVLDDSDSNSRATLRQNQYRKSLKTKPNEKHQAKRSHFSELINSLKLEEDLIYSPSVSEEQMLLSQTKPQINFLQECQVQRQPRRDGLQIKQRKLINCQKENNKYVKKMSEVRTDQAVQKTSQNGNTLELFNYDLKDVDLKNYLDKFDWRQFEVIKFVGTGLEDSQFNQLLNYILKTKVHSLLLPSNDLQEISLDALLNFNNLHTPLKVVSLQRNNINKLHSTVRSKISLLSRKGLKLYI